MGQRYETQHLHFRLVRRGQLGLLALLFRGFLLDSLAEKRWGLIPCGGGGGEGVQLAAELDQAGSQNQNLAGLVLLN